MNRFTKEQLLELDDMFTSPAWLFFVEKIIGPEFDKYNNITSLTAGETVDHRKGFLKGIGYVLTWDQMVKGLLEQQEEDEDAEGV